MLTTLRQTGNSRGILIPVAFLASCQIEDQVDMQLQDGQIVIKPVRRKLRDGWFGSPVSGAALTQELAQAQVWDAVKCHQTQIREYQKLLDLPDEDQLRLWCTNKYYRVFSQVPAAGGLETDLFDGLRHLSGDSHS